MSKLPKFPKATKYYETPDIGYLHPQISKYYNYDDIQKWREVWLKEAKRCELKSKTLLPENVGRIPNITQLEERARTIHEMLGDRRIDCCELVYAVCKVLKSPCKEAKERNCDVNYK